MDDTGQVGFGDTRYLYDKQKSFVGVQKVKKGLVEEVSLFLKRILLLREERCLQEKNQFEISPKVDLGWEFVQGVLELKSFLGRLSQIGLGGGELQTSERYRQVQRVGGSSRSTTDRTEVVLRSIRLNRSQGVNGNFKAISLKVGSCGWSGMGRTDT